MCFYITVAVERKHKSLLKAKLRGSFTVSPIDNPSILSNLKPGQVAFVVTDGMCSCSLYTRTYALEDTEEKVRRKYSKYKKHGWTEAKINRAIADSLSRPKPDFLGLRSDLRSQLADLASEAGRVFLVVHYYSDGTETEEVPIIGKKVLSCETMQNNDESVEEDTLIEILP